MFNWLRRLMVKKTIIKIRLWEPKDIPVIIAITQQGEYPLDSPTLAQWMASPYMYGIVITKNKRARGFAVVFFPEMPRSDIAEIQFLRVDNECLRQEFGTRMLDHLRAMLSVWEKTGLSVDISEYNEVARQFLMKNKFVITVMHEAHDTQGEMIDAFYTLRYPPPYGPRGYNDGTILIDVDGTITREVSPKTP